MMKNNYLSYLLLVLLTGLWSCKDEDNVFEQTADERVNQALTTYQQKLVEAPYGWKGIIYPKGGGVYSFYFKFNDQNRVVMYSDFDTKSAASAKESSYRLKAMQTPSLIFDTYSYLHVLADPDGSINGGAYGEGLQSDYEFSFMSDTLNADNITLTGTKNQSKLILTQANQEESVAYGNGALAKSLLFSNISKYLTYFKRITIGGVQYEIAVNQNTRSIKLSWLVGTTVNSFNSEYYYTPTGVSFITPFVNGSQTINGFTNITWNETTAQVGLTAGNSNSTIISAEKPIFVDLAAAKRWWNDPIATGGDWRTFDGFHVNGKDNAYGVDSLTAEGKPYGLYIFQPGGPGYYDLLAPAFIDDNSLSLIYYNVISSAFTSDGKVVFSLFRDAGESIPVSGPFINTKRLFLDPSGFYLVQTSATTYDMVSAKDAKSWISWF